ncbi:TRAP dicarboxylate transporter, DctM subunit [Candidatus Vecturithrix granuli]|uniref:TRAP dicarboxylate transporter, DctM subunit n=1 Tax=Vecturithrix granuli TaxID=1499967 RepID=A0A081C5G5_VECG1|nr:TRAP dicarboxylate transporter, DctM subunit [Candidatus Vecturithrix granuli]
MIDPGIVLFVVFFALLLLGAPIGVAIGCAGVFTIWRESLGMPILSANFFAGIAKFPLLAIPFFILAGIIFERAGIAKRLIEFIKQLVGAMYGGLAVVTVAAALFWGAVSGSGPATVAALGMMLIPAMAATGYPKPFAAAITSASSGLAIIIPPSIAFIIYGYITGDSVAALFAAGIIPGIVVGLALAATVYIISRKRGYRGEPRTSWKAVWIALLRAFWGLLAPVIILGGIYGGIATPTEAAVVAVFYGLLVGFFIYRTMHVKDIYKILVDSAVASAVVMLIVSFAGIFSWAGQSVNVMDNAANFILSITSYPMLILILMNIVLLISGMFLDAISIYYVFLPIFIPLMEHFGWNSIWFGVLMTVNLAIGQITPPIAVNLYVGANIANISLEEISKPVIPFILASIVALAILIIFPEISLMLPRLFGYIQ